MPDLDALVSIEAVEAQMAETLVSPEREQAEVFVARARAEMRRHVPGLDLNVQSQIIDPVIVTGVGVDIALRALENRRIGWRVTQQDFPEVSTRYSEQELDDLVYITPAQIASLTPDPGPSAALPPNAYVVGLGG